MPFAPVLDEKAGAPEVRTVLKEAGAYLLGLQRVAPDKRDDTWRDDTRSATNAINEYDRILTALERSEEPAPESRGPAAAHTDLGELEARSLGEQFVGRTEFSEWSKRAKESGEGAARVFPSTDIRGSMLSPEFRVLLDSSGDDNAALLRPVGQPAFPAGGQGVRRQRLFVRDVLSVVQTNLASVPYIRELNPLTNETGATAVAEGAAKAEVTMEFEQYDAPIRKIAAWIPATMEILEDAPTLRGYIDTRLAYMLALREEQQVLNGPGTGPNIKGIRLYTGVQDQPTVADDLPAVIGLSIGLIENVDGEADAVALNPLDYWKAVTERHATQFDGGNGGNAPAQVPGITWGLAAIRTRAMESGKLLTGSYRLGATLLDRMRTTIRMTDSHDDWFIYNKVAIVAEERVGLAVHREDFFVEGTITFT